MTSDQGSIPGSPYKFLNYYADTPLDIRKFAGRDREIQEVLARIVSERTCVIYGASGIGKTSMLLAGVFPALRERGYFPIYVRVLIQPVEDLERAVRNACRQLTEDAGVHTQESGSSVALSDETSDEDVPAATRAGPATGESGPPSAEAVEGEPSLKRLLQQSGQIRPLVIVIDQFEEFFLRFEDAPDERARFIVLVSEIVRDPTLNVRVVFSLREDYVASLDEFRPAIASPFANEYRLRSLTASGARSAIIQPLVVEEVGYDRELVKSLLDLLEKHNYDPLLLQIACTEVYRAARKSADTLLTAKHVRQIGSFEEIFARYLQEAVQKIPEGLHVLVRLVLDALITRQKTKRAVTAEDFQSEMRTFEADREDISTVLEILADNQLLRRQERGAETWYELTHDRLVQIVEAWLNEDAKFFGYRRARGLLAGMTGTGDSSYSVLLNREMVEKTIGPYRAWLQLSSEQMEYILVSAICSGSSQVGYWADRFGRPAAVELLRQMTKDEDTDRRRHAVRSAAILGDENGALAEICLDVALRDASPDVRLEAAGSFAGIALPKQLEQLRAALGNRETKRRAYDILAEIL